MHTIQSIILASIQSLYSITLTENEIEITPAPKRELGEYCIGAFSLAKLLGKSPNIIASEIARELAKHTDIFTSTSATGGYVNFFLTDRVWMKLFQGIVIASGSEAIQNTKEQDFSLRSASLEMTETKNQEPRTKNQPTIIVDYIGANVGKPLHIGHICTPSIGQVICNIYSHLGYRAIGDSHFGDWGGIFGKLIVMIKIIDAENKKEGNVFRNIDDQIEYQEISKRLIQFTLSTDEDKKKRIYELLPSISEKWGKKITNQEYSFLELMFESYLLITIYSSEYEFIERKCREEFQLLSKGDIKNTQLWQWITNISITETEKKLDLLNVHATYNIGESFYEGIGLPRPNDEKYPLLNGENNDKKCTMKDIVAELIKSGIATKNEDGSVGVVFPDESKLPSCVLQKKDGTGLYLTSDLAAIRYRLTNGWNPEKIIYSVDVRQQLHLRQVFWIAKKAWGKELGADSVEIFHAFNGFIKLKEGAMSTRHGTVIFLEALIDEGNERTEKILEEKGRIGEKALKEGDIQAITIAAIKYSYLAQDREKDVTFDWDKALSFEGNSGPYIQYAYVRARKIGTSVIASESEAIQETKNESSFGLDRHASLAMTETTKNIELSSYDKSLIQVLARFDEVVDTVAKTYKPHHLALYAYDLAVVFNSFYVHTPKILEETDEGIRSFRLTLVQKTAEQLKKSFELLAIQMPSEM